MSRQVNGGVCPILRYTYVHVRRALFSYYIEPSQAKLATRLIRFATLLPAHNKKDVVP